MLRQPCIPNCRHVHARQSTRLYPSGRGCLNNIFLARVVVTLVLLYVSVISLSKLNVTLVEEHQSVKESYTSQVGKTVLLIIERFSKPNIRFGSGRTGSKIVSKFRLTHNRKLRSANSNTICHTICMLSAAALRCCRKLRSLCPKEVFFVKLCKSGGFLLPSPRSLVIPWPTPFAHSFTDDGHVPGENLLPK